MGWIKDIFNYISLSREMKKLYDDGLVEQFSKLYGVKFRYDNARRLYAVINPTLQNIQNDGATQIFEFGQDGLTDKTYIKQWILLKLSAVEKLITAENLLDVLTFDIREITIDNQPTGNYVIIFTPIGFKEFDYAWKHLLYWVLGVLGVTAVVLGGLFSFGII